MSTALLQLDQMLSAKNGSDLTFFFLQACWLEVSMIWWDERPLFLVGSDGTQPTTDLSQSVSQHESTQLLAATIDIDDDYVRQAGRLD